MKRESNPNREQGKDHTWRHPEGALHVCRLEQRVIERNSNLAQIRMCDSPFGVGGGHNDLNCNIEKLGVPPDGAKKFTAEAVEI